MINVYCLHGLLGLPNDWEFLNSHFKGIHFHFVDIYKNFDPSKGIKEFSQAFNSSVKVGDTNLLIGYSMGGRLGLNALIDQPDLWSKAVFISTHPGLEREEARSSRILQDGIWAMRFLTEKWETLIEKWNQQSVFAYSVQMEKNEMLFNRDLLADALTHWGLGQQENLRRHLKLLSLPVYWISGANDQKFCQLGKSLHFQHPDSKVLEIEQAGHRVPWDNQQAFVNIVKRFLL